MVEAFKEYTNAELFKKASQWAADYAQECVEHPEIDNKPKALQYRARAVRQFLDEVERRASELSTND